MTTVNIPQTWNDTRDVPFFTLVARLFSADFTYGAGVLLATNANLDDSVTEAFAVMPMSAPSALAPASPLTTP